MDTQNNKSRNIVIGIIILIVIVLALSWLFSRSGGSGGPALVGESLNSDESDAPLVASSLVIGDQLPGSVIFISQVILPQGGWVAIQRDEVGAPGAVVARRYFSADERVGSIALNQPTLDGESYFAVLYADGGDNTFDVTRNELLRSATGEIVAVKFRTTANLMESKS